MIPAKYFVGTRPVVKVFPCGREICAKSTQGKAEYRFRTIAMAERQDWRCALCGLPMGETTASFDHEAGRGSGGGKRDDRIEVDGVWQNGAVHVLCNGAKGSQRIPYIILQGEA